VNRVVSLAVPARQRKETIVAERTTVDIARAFTEAWTSQDMAAAGNYVGEDVVFDGPLGHTDGKAQYLEGLSGLIRALGVTGVRILAAFGDETQALLICHAARRPPPSGVGRNERFSFPFLAVCD
jgi:hypothetical protein